ncbi:MAG: SURF1 family cytochrome oxidase biogenesis protein [Hyphomicrobium aestuarii]|nr:SURF1 family cytochrome oxidase biogenesis protein [Hyphomicrobium aestuarii]
MAPISSNRGLLLPTTFALAALALLIGLGTWQLNRKIWKDALQTRIDQRLTWQPAAIADLKENLVSAEVAALRKGGEIAPGAKVEIRNADIGDAAPRFLRDTTGVYTVTFGRVPDSYGYYRVTATGRFLHDQEQFVYAPHQTFGPGFNVHTPLKLANNAYVMVNRGYVTEALKNPSSRLAGQVPGEVEVTGLLRYGGERATFDPDRDPKTGVWYWRDLTGLVAAAVPTDRTSVYNFIIEAQSDPAQPGGWPKGGTTIVKLSNRHLEYAMTWYGLAATLIAVYGAFVLTTRRRASNAAPP